MLEKTIMIEESDHCQYNSVGCSAYSPSEHELHYC
jgi:hypothetical protein